MNTKFDKNNNQNVNANKDMVNHPSHYQSESGLEVIDVIKAFTSNLTGIEATDTGNVLKYMCRWKNKNGVEDLKKAKWYLEHLIVFHQQYHELFDFCVICNNNIWNFI